MSLSLALSSLVVGLMIGSAGVGGVLLIPFLMLFGGLPVHQAMATALFSFFFTGVLATFAFQKHGSISWPTTLPVCAGSLISGYLGAMAGAGLSDATLALVLSSVIVLSSLFSLFSPSGSALSTRLEKRGNLLLLTGIGLFTGFLCGMTGAGGGIISLPLMLLCGYPTLASIGTSQVLQSVVSLSGSIGNYSNGLIVFSVAWWVTAWELIGVGVGVRIAHKLPVARLRSLATLLCLGIGLYIGLRSLAAELSLPGIP